ncbi:uncharacterized protein EDB93DRAFT_1243607 [Suillus bovinus]|uniref:uncharacterized protein n=1 Tax=Suillus bovinus TaxID=48563 RepID=UPI001B85F5E7|nr:uncharacterized protein EDB93DRAFT_1243607 [Suillus bovinus]KAG2128052.1 hypothetical protein EDB93DRAFT_1243607 [Suillus bovinus]
MSNSPPPVKNPYDPTNALDDIPGLHWALHEQRLYFATGFGLIQCVKGLMSFEDKDLLAAINHTKRGIAIASAHRKRPGSFAGRLAGYIVPSLSTSGTEWIAGMTPVERHAELVYAESLYQKSLLGIVYSGDWLAFIREVLNMRTTISIYRQLGKWIETVDAAYDPHFRSGVYLGLGMSHLVLSMMPGKLLALVELFGYKGDRKFGLELLERAGGWSANGKVVEREAEGVRRAICDMSLLIFHLVLSAFTFEGVDVRKAAKILEWNLKRYPNGVFFLFGAGRLALVRSQPSKALTYYVRAAQAQTQYRNLHHISWWESAVACLGLWRVAESRSWWGKLGGEATWSKATYTYGEAACLATLGEHAEAKKLMERVQGLRQKIAGKSIPVEKFVARKARKYLAQSDRLLLPALELAYVFHAIAHAPREVIARQMIPAVGDALRELGLELSSGSEDLVSSGSGRSQGGAKAGEAKKGKDKKVESRSGYWDDVCLARFLEGVCWRFVAYPDPDADLEPDENIPFSPENARTCSERAFRAVFEHGPDIELDHYIVYYAHFEYGRLLARTGNKDGARMQFDLVLSGKPLEVNAAGRKGKYSLENALHVRTNAALEALDQNRLL